MKLLSGNFRYVHFAVLLAGLALPLPGREESVTPTIGSQPQQTFRAFRWTVSPDANPYMLGLVTKNIRDEFARVIFEDLNTKIVRLWYGKNFGSFKKAYVSTSASCTKRENTASNISCSLLPGTFPTSTNPGRIAATNLCRTRDPDVVLNCGETVAFRKGKGGFRIRTSEVVTLAEMPKEKNTGSGAPARIER